MILLYALLAFTIAVLLTRYLCQPGTRWHILDYPNERSLHTRPTPRTGGLAILAAIYITSVAAPTWPPTPMLAALAVGGLAVAVISFLDDRTGISPLWRILVHVGAALLLVAGGLALPGVNLPGMYIDLAGILGVSVSVVFVLDGESLQLHGRRGRLGRRDGGDRLHRPGVAWGTRGQSSVCGFKP